MTNDSFTLGLQLDVNTLVSLSRTACPKVTPHSQRVTELEAYRLTIEKSIQDQKVTYGVNTGFGYLSQVRIPKEQLEELQLNLIRSHACGVGELAPPEIVRSLLILRAHTFLLGHSGISISCLNTLLKFIEKDLLPKIPMKGSVGASGDLAPLAHLALGLIGEGSIYYQGAYKPASEALSLAEVEPLKPSAKEGLSLINGTHFMTAIGAHAIYDSTTLAKTADIIACLSLDAIRGTTTAFDPRIQNVRKQPGQGTVARNLLRLIGDNDEIMASHQNCSKVQDPYSFRCIPQVHGATRDALDYCKKVINIELNSVTDNPLVFHNEDIISGGNFHGQPVALALDFLAIAIAELGSISERRIEKMTNPNLSGLPAFVTAEGGLNSGYMIPHVVSAALASENKVFCHPASVDSIPTSADKEDHVSMGPISARKAQQVISNVADILSIELLTACQGLELLHPLKPGSVLNNVYNKVRELSPFMKKDRSLSEDISIVSQAIMKGEFISLVENDGINLS